MQPELNLSALIADDNVDNRNICRIILEKCGFSITEATTGAEAIELIKVKPYALLVLDMQMPVVDGRSVIQWMNANGHRPKNVVILTANSHWVTDEIQDYADFVMHKPIAIMEFTQFMRRLREQLLTAAR
jgi:CheY-like chemotaxis protein